ncbi:MAG: glycoside hydrolase family 88 protein [Sphaerochaetaceae bacterium]
MENQAITKQEIKQALQEACSKIRSNLPLFTNHCQNHSSVNSLYPQCRNDQWTCGFWPGEIWLAYEATGDCRFRQSGDILVSSFLSRIKNHICVDTHDMGFLYTPSCVSAYKLTGNKEAREAAMLAADQLASRFQKVGEFIQAWGAMGEKENYRYIIDSLLNLPLLYWATSESGDEKYGRIAQMHTSTCIANSFRSDYSTFHTFFMDSHNGEPLRGETCQGYRSDSSWARGQAWGIYGLALAYKYNHESKYIDLFRHASQYYLSRLPVDMVPYWDLIFTQGNEPRDSSCASIVACGMLEMAKYLGGEESSYYTNLAKEMVGSLFRNYRVKVGDVSNGLVYHGTYSKKSPYNTCTQEGVDECVSWGDYFYMEALTRLSRAWDPYW